MKKIYALGIIAIFLLSLVPAAFAETGSDDSRAEIKADARIKANNNGARAETRIKAEARAGVREDYKERLKILKESGRNKLEGISEEKSDILANLSSDRLQKISELDKRQIERLAELGVRNLDKITSLKKERLERLAELEKDKLERIASLNESEMEKASNLGRGRLKALANLDQARLRAELKSIHIVRVKNADGLNRKNVTRAELIQLRERFDKAKEEFKNAKDGLNEERKSLKEAKEKGDEKASLDHAKNYLLRVADALTNHLEKLKDKVQENKNIADDAEAKIVAEIDAKIAEVAEIKAEVQAAATKEQVKEASKKLREIWGRLKHIIDLHAKRIVSARVEGIANRGLVLEKQLDNLLERAREKGIEINVSAEMSLFSDKIALSKDKYTQAQAKLSEALELRAKNESVDSGAKALMDEANQLLKESRDALKEAHDVLKAIVKKIKEAMPEADLSEDVEVEVEGQ